MTAVTRPAVLRGRLRVDRISQVGLDRRTRLARARTLSLAGATAGAGTSAAALVFALWFRTGAFYAHGDLAPFVRDSVAGEAGWMWNHQNTAAGGPTYDVVRVIELAFVRFAHLIGGGDALGQRLLFAAVFALAASGVAAVASRFVARPWLVFLAGMVGAFSPLTMVNLPNILIPLCVGLAGWFTALTIDAASPERTARPRLLAILTIGLAYIALNPPLLAISLVWLFVLPFVAAAVTGTSWSGIGRGFVFLARAALWALPLALWWLVPYVVTLRTATDAGTITANTSAFAWSWAHAHGSLDRVLALVAKWSWPDTKQGLNASALASPGWLGLAFVLPMGLLAAPLAARPARRRAALWLLLGGLVVALVGKGLNAPGRALNAWAYLHIPGMFLFREPVSKVGTVLVLAVIVGWILTIDGLATWSPVASWRGVTRREVATSWMARAGVAVLAIAPFVFAMPMLTGDVLQGSDHVRVPDAWRQVAHIVNSSSARGKALVLPLDDFYQVPTTWGFYGADNLPARLLRRPTIVRNPQAYIESSGTFDDLAGAVENGLVGSDSAAVSKSLSALGVSDIIVRKDIDFASSIRAVRMADPAALRAGLAAVPGIHRIASTAIGDVYEVAAAPGPVVALGGLEATPAATGAALAAMVTSAPTNTAVVTSVPRDLQSDWGPVSSRALNVDLGANSSVTSPAAGTWDYQRRGSDATLLEITAGAHEIVLRDPDTVTVGAHELAPRPSVSIPTRAAAVAVDVGGTPVNLSAGRAFARFAPGTVVRPLALGSTISSLRWGTVGDCNRYDNLGAPTTGLHANMIPAADGSIVRLRATRHSACVSAPVPDVGANDAIHISLQQLSVRGAAPRTCLWQQGLGECARLAWSVEKAGDWYTMSATYRVPRGAGTVSEVLYADEPSDGSTTSSEAWYRRIEIGKLIMGNPTRVTLAAAPSGQVELSKGKVPVVVASNAPQPKLGTLSAAGDCARTDERSLPDLGISAEYLPESPGTIRLRARHHTACVSTPIVGLARAVNYELSFDARVRSGGAPRVCLWDATAERCAVLDPIATPGAKGGTFRYRARFDPDASGWQLFLYADSGNGATTIDYSAVRLHPVVDGSVTFRSHASRPTVPPAINAKMASPAHYRVSVRDAGKPFVLALSDAFSNDWKLRGLPKGATATHVELDGYRNGWAISAQGNLKLSLDYAPARAGRAAIHVSQLAAFVLAGSLLLPVIRARSTRRRRLLSRPHFAFRSPKERS